MTQTKRNHVRKNRFEDVYRLFIHAEEEQSPIDLKEILKATGYTVGTIKEYTTKKWRWFLTQMPNNTYIVKGLKGCPLDDFIEIHKKGLPPKANQLIVTPPPHVMNELQIRAQQRECAVHDLILEALERYLQTD